MRRGGLPRGRLLDDNFFGRLRSLKSGGGGEAGKPTLRQGEG